MLQKHMKTYKPLLWPEITHRLKTFFKLGVLFTIGNICLHIQLDRKIEIEYTLMKSKREEEN